MTTARSNSVLNVAWTKRNDTFAHGIECLYTERHLFDLTIVTKNGGKLQAHRTVMSSVSSKIQEMVKDLPKNQPRE